MGEIGRRGNEIRVTMGRHPEKVRPRRPTAIKGGFTRNARAWAQTRSSYFPLSRYQQTYPEIRPATIEACTYIAKFRIFVARLGRQLVRDRI